MAPDLFSQVMDLALDLFKQEPDRLTAELEAINSDSKPNPNFLLGLAEFYLRSGNRTKALICYRRVVELPKLDGWMHMRAIDRMYSLDSRLALQVARRSIDLDPTNPTKLATLGSILRRVGDDSSDRTKAHSSYVESARCFQKALYGTDWGTSLDAADSWAELGIAYDHLGRTADSVVCYRKALRFLGSNPNSEWIRQSVRRLTKEDPEVQALEDQLRAKPALLKDAQAAIWRKFHNLYVKRATYWDGVGDAGQARENRLAAAKALQKATELDGDTRSDWVELGKKLYTLDDKLGAAKAFRKALAMDSNDADTLNWLADILLSRGENTEEALHLAQKSAQLDPANMDSLANAGWAHYLLGHFSEAEALLARSLARPSGQTDPRLAEMWTVLGIVYEELGKGTRAFDAYKTAVRLNPANPSIEAAYRRPRSATGIAAAAVAAYREGLAFENSYFTLSALNFKYHYDQEIVELSKERLRRNPRDLDAMDNLAGRLFFLDPREGLRVSQNMLQLWPDSLRARLYLGASLVNLGRLEEAEQTLSSLMVTVDPSDRMLLRDAWYQFGNIYCGRDQFENAIAAYRKSLQYDEQATWVWTGHSLALAKAGHYGSVVDSVRRQLANVNGVHLLSATVETLVSANRLSEARTVTKLFLDKYEEARSQGSLVMSELLAYELCDTLFKCGDVGAAEAMRADLQKRFSDSTTMWNVLCWLLVEWKRYEEAIPLCRAGMERFPSDPNHPANLGWCYFKLNDLDQALTYLERALIGTAYGQRSDSGQASSWGILGQVYERKGRLEDAREAFHQALKLDPKEKDAVAGLKRIGG